MERQVLSLLDLDQPVACFSVAFGRPKFPMQDPFVLLE